MRGWEVGGAAGGTAGGEVASGQGRQGWGKRADVEGEGSGESGRTVERRARLKEKVTDA